MDAPLCPRCGFAVIYWTAGRFPFCAECGWNFDEVHKNLGKNERSTAWIVGALPFLVGALLVRHRANWSAALILFGIAGAIIALVASTRFR